MTAVGLQKGKATAWLRAPEPTGLELLRRKFAKPDLDLLEAGADLDMVMNNSLSPRSFIEDLQSLKPNELAALATLMGISVEELSRQIGQLR